MLFKKRLMNSDEHFMMFALEKASECLAEDLLPVGAIIVYNNSIISVDRKRKTSNMRLNHAETNALHSALKCLPSGAGVTVYSTLEPCLMCFSTMIGLKVERVVYAMEDPFGGGTRVKFHNLPPMITKLPMVSPGVKRLEARCLMRSFFESTADPFWKDAKNILVEACLEHDH